MSLSNFALGLYGTVRAMKRVTQESKATASAIRESGRVAKEVSSEMSKYTDDQQAMLDKIANAAVALGGFIDGQAVGAAFSGQAISDKLRTLLDAQAKYLTDSSQNGINRLIAAREQLVALEKFIQQFIDPKFTLTAFWAKPVSSLPNRKTTVKPGKSGMGSLTFGTGILPNQPPPPPPDGENYDGKKSTGDLP